MNRPKIVLVLDKMIPAGTQRHVLHLVHGLSDKIEFHVVSLEGWGTWESELKKYDVVSHHYPMHRLYDLSGWQVYRNLTHMIKTIKPVGVETFMFTAHILGSFAAHAAGGVPVISSRREMILWRKKIHIFFRKWANRYCSLHLANSKAVAEDVRVMEAVPEENIKHLANGLELPNNPQPSIKLQAGKTHAVVVAALKTVKQHKILLQAIALNSEKLADLCVHFIGEGPLKADLEKFSLENGLKSGINFIGRLDSLFEELPQFDFAILPSKSEGFSNSLLECLGSGLPAIAFDVDGNRETIVNNKTGFLVEPQSITALGQAIVTMVEDVPLRQEMGQEAKRSIQKNYSSQKMCDLKYNYYKEVFRC